jgi:lipase ATG15
MRNVADKLLADNADWKPEFNGEVDDDGKGWFSNLGWGWRRKPEEGSGGGDDGDETKMPMREVPLARPANEVEGVDGVCTVCPVYFPCRSLVLKLRPPSRIALSGNLGASRTVPNL